MRVAFRIMTSSTTWSLATAPTLPRVRRLKPAIFKRHAFFGALARDPKITSLLSQLIGPSIRLHGGKLNMKSAGFGSPVEWHQDWAFYHTATTTCWRPASISTIATSQRSR